MSLDIWLVEDNPMNVELARDLLEAGGHSVTVATSGAALRALARGGRAPSIVLMDILLPDSDGVTLMQELRAQPRLAHVPIIAASPHEEVLRRTSLYAGVVPLLVAQGRDTDEMFANATEAAVRAGFVREGDRVVIVAGVPVGQPGQTNLLKVETV